MKSFLIMLQRSETVLFRTQLNQQVSEANSNQTAKQKYKVLTYLACEFEIIIISKLECFKQIQIVSKLN